MAAVRGALESMRRFVGEVHGGVLKGVDGRAMTDIVNIGIGGSDLGPRMLVRAMRKFAKPGLGLHFVSTSTRPTSMRRSRV